MFDISQNVFVNFSAREMESYLRKLMLFLRSNVPEMADVPDAQLLNDLRGLTDQAQSFGMVSEQGIAVYALTAAQLGIDFVARFPGALEILRSSESEARKAELLEAFTLNLLELLEG